MENQFVYHVIYNIGTELHMLTIKGDHKTKLIDGWIKLNKLRKIGNTVFSSPCIFPYQSIKAGPKLKGMKRRGCLYKKKYVFFSCDIIL